MKIPIETGSEIQVGGFVVQVCEELELEDPAEEVKTQPAAESPAAETEAEGRASPNSSQQFLDSPCNSQRVESPSSSQQVLDLPCNSQRVESPSSSRAIRDSPSYSPESSPASSLSSSIQPKLFNAIYGKASATRKHKLYPKDGTIEVQGLKAVLKNSKGKVFLSF